MAEIQLPTIRLYYEEYGAGVPLLLIHGTGSDADAWGAALPALARLGRVIAYDRRGCSRSQRPEAYPRITPAEHANDAASLLAGLNAMPAIVIGRSYGGEVALELARRVPERARALVLLDGGGQGLSPEADAFLAGLADRVRAAVAARGPAAAGEALLRGVLGEAGYAAAPEGLKVRVAANGPAIVAELEGLTDESPDPARLRTITCPVLVVAAASAPLPLRRLNERLAATLPNARLEWVEGGHLVAPDHAQVVSFLHEVLTRG